jgi:hypothetical protein
MFKILSKLILYMGPRRIMQRINPLRILLCRIAEDDLHNSHSFIEDHKDLINGLNLQRTVLKRKLSDLERVEKGNSLRAKLLRRRLQKVDGNLAYQQRQRRKEISNSKTYFERTERLS